jgi:hypothetical protein
MEERSFTESEAIRHIRYDEESEELTVWFATGRTYRYYRVPESEWDGFSTAGSAGTYFNRRIVGRYRFDEIDSPWNRLRGRKR